MSSLSAAILHTVLHVSWFGATRWVIAWFVLFIFLDQQVSLVLLLLSRMWRHTSFLYHLLGDFCAPVPEISRLKNLFNWWDLIYLNSNNLLSFVASARLTALLVAGEALLSLSLAACVSNVVHRAAVTGQIIDHNESIDLVLFSSVASFRVGNSLSLLASRRRQWYTVCVTISTKIMTSSARLTDLRFFNWAVYERLPAVIVALDLGLTRLVACCMVRQPFRVKVRLNLRLSSEVRYWYELFILLLRLLCRLI